MEESERMSTSSASDRDESMSDPEEEMKSEDRHHCGASSKSHPQSKKSKIKKRKRDDEDDEDALEDANSSMNESHSIDESAAEESKERKSKKKKKKKKDSEKEKKKRKREEKEEVKINSLSDSESDSASSSSDSPHTSTAAAASKSSAKILRLSSSSSKHESREQRRAARAERRKIRALRRALTAPLPPRDIISELDPNVESIHFRKSGPYTLTEQRVAQKAVDQYAHSHNLSPAEKERLLMRRGGGDFQGAWGEIARCLPLRSYVSVWEHIVRTYRETRKSGRWSQEETQQLKSLYEEHGPKWEAIGRLLNRTDRDCRDKYRLIRDDFETGRWTPEENEMLTKWVMRQAALARGLSGNLEDGPRGFPVTPEGELIMPPDSGILWTAISSMIGTRSSIQCRQHWNDYLLPRFRIGPERLEETSGNGWTIDEEKTMLELIYQQGAETVSEIDWNKLSEQFTTFPKILMKARFRELVRRLTNLERFQHLAEPDASLDTIIYKIRKHLWERDKNQLFHFLINKPPRKIKEGRPPKSESNDISQPPSSPHPLPTLSPDEVLQRRLAAIAKAKELRDERRQAKTARAQRRQEKIERALERVKRKAEKAKARNKTERNKRRRKSSNAVRPGEDSNSESSSTSASSSSSSETSDEDEEDDLDADTDDDLLGLTPVERTAVLEERTRAALDQAKLAEQERARRMAEEGEREKAQRKIEAARKKLEAEEKAKEEKRRLQELEDEKKRLAEQAKKARSAALNHAIHHQSSSTPAHPKSTSKSLSSTTSFSTIRQPPSRTSSIASSAFEPSSSSSDSPSSDSDHEERKSTSHSTSVSRPPPHSSSSSVTTKLTSSSETSESESENEPSRSFTPSKQKPLPLISMTPLRTVQSTTTHSPKPSPSMIRNSTTMAAISSTKSKNPLKPAAGKTLRATATNKVMF